MNHLPLQRLETDKIVLREPILPDDVDSMFRLRSDPQVNRYIDREVPITPDSVRLFLSALLVKIQQCEVYYWMICLKPQSEPVGTICLWNLNQQDQRAELGFELFPQFQGKGIMSQSVRLVESFAFDTLQLHKLEAWVHPDNHPSIRLLEKSGFEREAYFREHVYVNGEFHDMAVYGKLRPVK